MATEGTERRLCTIAARNYAPSVLLLVETFAAHHPDVPITVLFVDATPEDRFPDFPCEVLGPEALPLDRDDFLRMATYYDVMELSTALKPFLLRYLLDRGAESVMYLDPDIEVFAPLDDLFELAEEHAIALTPHLTEADATRRLERPRRDDRGQRPVQPRVRRGQQRMRRSFLDYWMERTRLHALSEQSEGLLHRPTLGRCSSDLLRARDLPGHGLQRGVLEPPRALARRRRVGPAGPSTARHFASSTTAATTPSDPLWLSKSRRPTRNGSASTSTPHCNGCSVSAPSGSCCARRGRTGRRPTAGSDRPSGVELDAHDSPPLLGRGVRRRGRTATRRRRTRSQRRRTTRSPSGCSSRRRRGRQLTRFQYALWNERSHYQRLFPDPLGADAPRFIEAARFDPTLLQPDRSSRCAQNLVRSQGGLPGVNLVGYLDGEFGVAAAGRMVARMVRASGIPMATTVLRPPGAREPTRRTPRRSTAHRSTSACSR